MPLLTEINSKDAKQTRTVSSMIEKAFALEWRVTDLDKFNDQILDILENSTNNVHSRKYDCLIYVISCHSSQHYASNGKRKTMLRDSFENEYCCNEKIFDKFNNKQCSSLQKKSKNICY